MSLTAAAIRLLASKGLTADEIADVADAMQGDGPTLSKGAERTRKWREKKAAERHGDVTGDASRDVTEPGPHVRVVNTSLPSLRSEELNPLTLPSGASPKTPKSNRSRKAPEAWRPSAATIDRLQGEGYSAGDLERALTRMRDHEFRDPRSDWDGAFRNWVRRDADYRPTLRVVPDAQRPDAKQLAREANYASAYAGAEIAARRRHE